MSSGFCLRKYESLSNIDCSILSKSPKKILGLQGIIENDKNSSTIIDFVMSCRVAQKRADITFLQWCLDYARLSGNNNLKIKLQKTSKNKPLRDLLASLPFKDVSSSSEDFKLLEISINERILDNEIIQIS